MKNPLKTKYLAINRTWQVIQVCIEFGLFKRAPKFQFINGQCTYGQTADICFEAENSRQNSVKNGRWKLSVHFLSTSLQFLLGTNNNEKPVSGKLC